MIRVLEVDLRVDCSMARRIQEVRDEREWVVILLTDFVEAPGIDTESKGAVLLFDKEDRSSVGRRGRSYEAHSKVFIDESLEGGELDQR